MKQTVNAPLALIVVGLCAVLAFYLFSRPQFQPQGEDEVFVLPFSPPRDESEVQALRQMFAPLGVDAIFPPLPPDRQKGVRLALVAPGSPAGIGGLKPGDLVLSFNGEKIGSPFGLAGAIGSLGPEEPFELVVERAGEQQTLTIPGIRRMPTKEELF